MNLPSTSGARNLLSSSECPQRHCLQAAALVTALNSRLKLLVPFPPAQIEGWRRKFSTTWCYCLGRWQGDPTPKAKNSALEVMEVKVSRGAEYLQDIMDDMQQAVSQFLSFIAIVNACHIFHMSKIYWTKPNQNTEQKSNTIPFPGEMERFWFSSFHPFLLLPYCPLLTFSSFPDCFLLLPFSFFFIILLHLPFSFFFFSFVCPFTSEPVTFFCPSFLPFSPSSTLLSFFCPFSSHSTPLHTPGNGARKS